MVVKVAPSTDRKKLLLAARFSLVKLSEGNVEEHERLIEEIHKRDPHYTATRTHRESFYLDIIQKGCYPLSVILENTERYPQTTKKVTDNYNLMTGLFEPLGFVHVPTTATWMSPRFTPPPATTVLDHTFVSVLQGGLYPFFDHVHSSWILHYLVAISEQSPLKSSIQSNFPPSQLHPGRKAPSW